MRARRLTHSTMQPQRQPDTRDNNAPSNAVLSYNEDRRSSLPVDGKVQPHELGEGRVVVAEHGGEVGRPVLGHVNGPDAAALAEQVAVDGGRNGRELGHQGHRVVERVLRELQAQPDQGSR